GDEDAGREVVEPPALRRPVVDAGAARQHGLGRGVSAERPGLEAGGLVARGVRRRLVGMMRTRVHGPRITLRTPESHWTPSSPQTRPAYRTVGSASRGAGSRSPPSSLLTVPVQPGRPAACCRRIASSAWTTATVLRSAARSL